MIPHWPEYQKEIDALLRAADPTYEQRVYLKPLFYVDGIATNPERYPLLARKTESLQKRYISAFLKEQGRISRNGRTFNARVWMLAEVVV
jgi:hypothetical protein